MSKDKKYRKGLAINFNYFIVSSKNLYLNSIYPVSFKYSTLNYFDM